MIWKWWESRPWHIWFSMLFLHNFSGWLSYTKTVCSVRLCNRSSCFCKPPARPPHWSTWMAACMQCSNDSTIWHLTWESQPTHANHRFLASIHAHLNQLRFRLASGRVTWRGYLDLFASHSSKLSSEIELLCKAVPGRPTAPFWTSSLAFNWTTQDTKRYEHSCKAFKFNFHSKANTLRQPTYLLLISECMGLQLSNSWNQKLACDIR